MIRIDERATTASPARNARNSSFADFCCCSSDGWGGKSRERSTMTTSFVMADVRTYGPKEVYGSLRQTTRGGAALSADRWRPATRDCRITEWG